MLVAQDAGQHDVALHHELRDHLLRQRRLVVLGEARRRLERRGVVRRRSLRLHRRRADGAEHGAQAVGGGGHRLFDQKNFPCSRRLSGFLNRTPFDLGDP